MTEFVTASANPDKVREIVAVLREAMPSLVLLPRPPEVPEVVEDADTLVGNARLKAVALMHATGLPAIADDTGLFVDALGGAPGVFAARYAGEHCTYTDNCVKLLAELSRVGAIELSQRTARFTSIAFVSWPDGRELWCEGSVEGVIVHEARGANGFGYDPLFAPIENANEMGGTTSLPSVSVPTFAELGSDQKNFLSHRARAFRALAAALASGQPGM